MDDALAKGFSAAILIPAIASTIKQAQREASEDLHLLADYHERSARQGGSPARLTYSERAAARRVGIVLVQQGFNGTAFFLMVKLAVMTGGAFGGMLAQVGITGNTMVTAGQTQRFNPAQLMFDRFGGSPDWVSRLSPEFAAKFAFGVGRLARSCGYGSSASRAMPDGPAHIRFAGRAVRPDRTRKSRYAN